MAFNSSYERNIRRTVVYNGWSEYYVNAAVKDRSTEDLSNITDLMEIFTDSDKYDYDKFPKTSERKNQFKDTKEGEDIMSKEIQDLIDKKEQQTTVNHIKEIMIKLKYTLEQAMDLLNIPSDQRTLYTGLVNQK